MLTASAGSRSTVDHGKLMWASAAAVAVSAVFFCWMLSGGSLDLLHSQLLGDFYEAQARSWLHGHWYISSQILSVEAITVHGRSYMYFGPVPALFRLPVVAFTHALDGRLTEVSMLVAFLVAMISASLLSWRIRMLVRPRSVVGTGEAVATAAMLVLLGSGSVLLFLASQPRIYSEDITWGLALSLAAYYQILTFVLSPGRRPLALAGVFSVLAFLTRVSVGVGPIAALSLVLLVEVAVRMAEARPTHQGRVAATVLRARQWTGLRRPLAPSLMLGLAFAVGSAVLLYVWINYARFGSLLSVPLDKQAVVAISASRRATLQANGGSLFGLKFAPTTLLQYVRPDALSFHRLFPWMWFPGPARVIGGVRFASLDWSSSVTATMPALAVLGLVGVVRIVRPTRRDGEIGLVAMRIPVLAAALGTVLALSIAYVAERYFGDFFPLLVLSSLTGLHVLLARATTLGRRPMVAAAGVVLAALALFGFWANLSLSLLYQRLLEPAVPTPTMAGFISFQENLDASLHGGKPVGVTYGAALPPPAPTGDLFVLGDCAGLYWSDGSQWLGVERTNATGEYRLRLTPAQVPAGTREPLLVSGQPGAGSYLVVDHRGGDSVSFDYLYQEGGTDIWAYGSPHELRTGQPYDLDVIFDSRLGEIHVSNGDQELYADNFFVRGGDVSIGTNPLGGPVAASFAGRIEPLPAQTGICQSLQRRART